MYSSNRKAWHVLYNTPTDNQWYNADANDVAFGVEGSYFPGNIERSRKSLDNMARVLAYLCNYWGIDYKQKCRDTKTFKMIKLIPETY